MNFLKHRHNLEEGNRLLIITKLRKAKVDKIIQAVGGLPKLLKALVTMSRKGQWTLPREGSARFVWPF